MPQANLGTGDTIENKIDPRVCSQKLAFWWRMGHSKGIYSTNKPINIFSVLYIISDVFEYLNGYFSVISI